MGLGSACDTILSFLRKFFSLIVAALMAVMTLLYVVGAGIIITKEKNFGKAGFAHFLGILSSIVLCIAYLILHFVPRKAYRLLYAISFLFLLSSLLVANSMGIAAPVVDDCRKMGSYDVEHLKNISIKNPVEGLGGFSVGSDNETVLGSLGEPVRYCGENALLFAGAFLDLIVFVIGLFDVQSVLLSRVKSKTYGERFVEMGISN